MEQAIRDMTDVELDRNMKRALRKSVNHRVNVERLLDLLLEESERRAEERMSDESKLRRFFDRCRRIATR